MIYVFFKINGVQPRVINKNDLINVELVGDDDKKLDQAWEESLMVLEKVPEKILGKPFTIERWSIRLSCKMHWRFKNPIRCTVKSDSSLKAMFSEVLEDQQQKSQPQPHTVTNQGDWKRGDCKLWSSKGSCTTGATCAFKHEEQCRGMGKET